MSRCTITIYQLLVDFIHQNTGMSVAEIKLKGAQWIVENGKQYIFDFQYPIFAESYKDTLETNFLMNYYVYEIGSETYLLFKQRLMTALMIKMPYYNDLYKTTLLELDPLADFSSTEKHLRDTTTDRTGTSDTNANTTTSTNNKSVYSDTPQGLLSGKDYATNATLGDNSVIGTSKNEGTTKDNAIGNETINIERNGNSIDKSTLLMRYRSALINVDMILFEDLKDLFMMIF